MVQPADAANIAIRRFHDIPPAALRLIDELNDELCRSYPEPGANHFRLGGGELAAGHGVFLVAYLGETPVGCGALRRFGESSGELKRMYVRPEQRGCGVGRLLLATLEDEAQALGLTTLLLETGERQAGALALYRGAGFSEVERFGEYVDSPLSVCLAKCLAANHSTTEI